MCRGECPEDFRMRPNLNFTIMNTSMKVLSGFLGGVALGAIAGIISEVCVPLHDQGAVVGVLNVESTNGVMLTHADLNLILAVSSHVTIALGRARIYQEMRERQEHFATIFRASPVTISITWLSWATRGLR